MILPTEDLVILTVSVKAIGRHKPLIIDGMTQAENFAFGRYS